MCVPLALAVVWVLLPASHDRDWREDYSRLPTVTFAEGSFTVANVRNWSYSLSGEAVSQEWRDVTIRKEDVATLFFVLEPFGDSAGIAHTMLAVTLQDGSGYVMSIEARREVGEDYHALQAALWPTYEYLFVWATERDMYGNSQYFANDDLYRYELDLNQDQVWVVVEAIARETQAVAEAPRWYNTLLANCTNVLARTLNRRTDARLSWDIARILPGYSAAYLYEAGLLAGDGELAELSETAYITPLIDQAYVATDPTDFSRSLQALQQSYLLD